MSTTIRARILLAVTTVFLCALPTSAQGIARLRDETWAAPATASARRNPLADRPEIRAGGARIFAQRCSACHGERGGGTAKAPDLTASDVQAQSDGTLFWKISTGNAFAGMPPFSNLPEGQRWQLALHLRTFSTPR
jgi:mono/diheme cytochrome c family protein